MNLFGRWLHRALEPATKALEPPRRNPGQQTQVDRETAALALYHFGSCPYCIRVRRVLRRLRLNIELRDARKNSIWENELLLQGGRLQVPCLRILDANGNIQWLYESDEIITYLRQRFPNPQRSSHYGPTRAMGGHS